MSKLLRLFEKYKCDKGHPHAYYIPYELYLSPLIGKAPKILEIGVLHGGSLRAWQEYFINPKLVAIDARRKWQKNVPDNCTFCLGSSGDSKFLKQVVDAHGSFDVVIDDGSHHVEHQTQAFMALWASVKPGGLYAIEDINVGSTGKKYNPLGLEPIFDRMVRMARRSWNKELVSPIISFFKRGVFLFKPTNYLQKCLKHRGLKRE